MEQLTLLGEVSQADRLKAKGIEMPFYKKESHTLDKLADGPSQMRGLTPRQWRAIRHMSEKGLVAQMCTPPNIRFKQLDTGEIVTFTIDELLKEYDEDRKELARMRNAEKRIMANNARRIVI